MRNYKVMDSVTKKRVALFLIAMVLGVCIGYMAGTYVTIKAVASVARELIDDSLISEFIVRYSNHYKGAYFP